MNTHFTPRLTVCALCTSALLIGLSSQVSAQLIAYDDFNDYTAGSAISGQTGGFGWSSAWSGITGATVSNIELSYNSGGIVRGGGNSMRVAGDANSAFRRDIFQTTDTSGQAYFTSFIFQIEGGEGALTSQAFTGIQAVDSNPVQNETLGFFGRNVGGSYTAGARVGSTIANDANITGLQLQYGETYFMVVEYSGWDGSRYTTSTVWFNPGTEDEFSEDTAIRVTTTVEDVGSSGFLGIMARTAGLSEENYILFDDFRVGETWDSVVTAPIPEPGTTALLFGGVVVGITLLRKHRK